MSVSNVRPRGDGGKVVHFVSQRKKRGRPKPRIQPPLTAMIDVTFQLLLFFILTMQFRQAEGQIPADLPRLEGRQSAVVTPLEPVTIRLRSANGDGVEIEISGYDLVIEDWQGLYLAMKQLRRDFGSGEAPVVIRPDANLPWAHALNALRQAQRGGFENIALPSRGEPQ